MSLLRSDLLSWNILLRHFEMKLVHLIDFDPLYLFQIRLPLDS